MKSALRDRIAVEENLASVEREMERSKSAGPQGYEVIMNTEWVFSTDGETPSGKAFVENGRDNNNAVYFYVTLEEEPEEVLYTSPVLEVGDKIQSFALDKTPPIGTYRGIVTYCLLDETGSVTGQVNAGVVIRVE